MPRPAKSIEALASRPVRIRLASATSERAFAFLTSESPMVDPFLAGINARFNGDVYYPPFPRDMAIRDNP